MNKDEEIRLRKVEDAIISFDNIAKTVIVDIKERVRTLEAHDETFSKLMYESCDIKTKEIDDKVKASKDNTYQDMRRMKSSLIKMIVGVMALTGSLFMLFIGGIVHFNNEVGNLHEKINSADRKSIKEGSQNTTNIKSISEDLKYIRSMIDQYHHGG